MNNDVSTVTAGKDFLLMERAKAGDQAAISELWIQYQRLINKFARRALSDPEDFIQEAYFHFLKAITYVKLEKVSHPDQWKFYGILNQYLMGAVNKYNGGIVRSGKNLIPNDVENVLDDTGDEEDFIHRSSNFNRLNTEDLLFQYSPEAILKPILDSKADKFQVSLTEYEAKFLELRRSGNTLSQISLQLNMPIGRVKQDLKNLKRRASSIFEVEYQYT